MSKDCQKGFASMWPVRTQSWLEDLPEV